MIDGLGKALESWARIVWSSAFISVSITSDNFCSAKASTCQVRPYATDRTLSFVEGFAEMPVGAGDEIINGWRSKYHAAPSLNCYHAGRAHLRNNGHRAENLVCITAGKVSLN